MTRKHSKIPREDSKRGTNRPSKVGPSSSRVPDKLPMRTPHKPEAARYERSGRSGRLKRRLGG